jgi:4-alpha-glucanotransferase
MKLNLFLRFHTSFGENIYVTINGEKVPMTFLNDGYWTVSFDATTDIRYHYTWEHNGTESEEWEQHRVVEVKGVKMDEITVIDTWNSPSALENNFLTQPFQTVFFKSKQTPKAKAVKGHTHEFRVKAPTICGDETLCLVGSGPALANWNSEAAVVMQRVGEWFVARVDLSAATFPLAYKYGVYNTRQKTFVRFEKGDNRMLFAEPGKKRITILHDAFAAVLPDQMFRGAGVAIPVFSLRSKNSFGVGEFADLKLLVDWAKSVNMKLVQLLPINDTTANHTWMDSYPYAPISVFALHPMYLNLEAIAGKEQAKLVKQYAKKKKQLNDLAVVDYEQVMKFKLGAIKELFAAMKDDFEKTESYQQFFDSNKYWLQPYAAFCYLRDKNSSPNFNTWKTHSSFDGKEIEKLCSPSQKHYGEIAIHYFIQYHLHLQLTDAVDYAHKNGLVMKGDLPIGIYRNSCDAWMAPELYNMNAQAGAPPDDFAVKGQNWGFPTYNWDRMKADGFAWWKQRFSHMSNYFDAFRIDHILGFFRIWSIPLDAVEGILGNFVPCLPVHINELQQRGISFNHHRFCQPYINDTIVGETFGNETEYVKNNFLNADGFGNYNLKPEFDSQRKVELWFDEHRDAPEQVKYGLFDLVSNFILIEEPNSQHQQFHFRISMESTKSFQWLDEYTKQQLRDLYVNYFFRRQDDFWYGQAMEKLPALKRSTNMLICGEDLGMVPNCVPDVMQQLSLLSLEIQRMPKNPQTKFFHPNDAPYLSVVTPSTHDMSTIRGWWEEDRNNTQQFFNQVMGNWGDAPFYCESWINKAIVLQHLYSPAMWSIFQLQDLLGFSDELRRSNPQEERINQPANPKHYWQYRMHLHLEDLKKAQPYNDELGGYIAASNRN